MLVLTRKVGESIAIGDDVKIIVMQIKGKQVRLGIKASPSTIVHREEIYQRIQEENKKAALSERAPLDHAGSLIGVNNKAEPATRLSAVTSVPQSQRIRNRLQGQAKTVADGGYIAIQFNQRVPGSIIM